jgi:hypothetical protein
MPGTFSQWFFALILACAAGFAQAPPAAPPAGSIAGVIRDSTGKPLPEIALVLTGAPGGRQTATTGEQGQFAFAGLPPGIYRLTAQSRSEVLGTKAITLDSGQELPAVELVVSPSGTISGRVLDDLREPAAGFVVVLMTSVYQSGARTYEVHGAVTPDPQGKYLLRGVKPGLSYLLVARRRSPVRDAISKVAADPEKREREPAETWFPDAPAAESASPVVLFDGEQRAGVDIAVKRLAARCVEATLQTAVGPAALEYQILDGAGISVASGRAAADGRVRDCRPEHGALRIVAFQPPTQGVGPLFGSVAIPAGDSDVANLRVETQPEITLHGVVAIEGETPPEAANASLSVGISPFGRPPLAFEKSIGADLVKSAIPGSFSLPATSNESLLSTRLTNAPKGFYVKDVTLGGAPVHGNRLPLGGVAAGAELRISIGRDGGSLSVQVKDEQGKPMPDVWVVASPADAAGESEMSMRLWGGITNPNGVYGEPLRPGKYLVVATRTWLNLNTETVSRLWRARANATPVEVGPNADLHLTLALTKTE